jgi:hypothetical protein
MCARPRGGLSVAKSPGKGYWPKTQEDQEDPGRPAMEITNIHLPLPEINFATKLFQTMINDSRDKQQVRD